jgi:stage II sporulation protein D
MRRALSLTALVALLALAFAAGADAAIRHVVKGRGWGHGIGLSQYGAKGLAEHGRSYTRILAHFYRNTELARSSPGRRVRVLLQPVDPYIRVRRATRLTANGEVTRLHPAYKYVIRRANGKLVVRRTGKTVGRFASPVRLWRPRRAVRLLGPALNGIRDGLYRGSVEVRFDRGAVTAINRVRLDPYAQGVVPGEMPTSWHMEALKAQAVAARSYALATRKPFGAFDQYPDTRSQVYRGVIGERARSNAAVRATSRQLLTYGGRPAVTYFFSTSGGKTENVENVFGTPPTPYLRGVVDPYDDGSPYHRVWRRTFTTGQMDARLGRYSPGRFVRIEVLKRGFSPRVVRARVHGTGGTRTIRGYTLRFRLGLRDSWARFYRVSTTSTAAVRAAKWGTLVRPPALRGAFEPAPRARRLRLERRVGDRWRTVKLVRTTRGGGYSVAVRRRGVYRVRAGDVAGPPVRVR